MKKKNYIILTPILNGNDLIEHYWLAGCLMAAGEGGLTYKTCILCSCDKCNFDDYKNIKITDNCFRDMLNKVGIIIPPL